MTDTIEVTVLVPAFDHDALLAEVSAWPLTGAVQDEDGVRLYLPAEAWTDDRKMVLAAWLDRSGHDAELQTRIVPPQNWNAAWEASIEPVRAGPFWIKPTWADLPAEASEDAKDKARYVIEVDPKMSFGTGHHATTRLMLRLLDGAVRPGDPVLDVGTGTGILAIAACRLGAASVLGVDIREAAVENARENVARNGVADRVAIRLGSLEAVSPTNAKAGFGVGCANITRTVLQEILPSLRAHIAPGGRLLLSGVFARNRDRLLEATAEHNFALDADATEDGWWGGRFVCE